LPKEPLILHDHILVVDPWYDDLMTGFSEGRISEREFQDRFVMPGIGFHRALYLCTRSLVEYRKYGQQVFCIGPTMQKLLCATSLDGMTTEDLRFPYDCFYIATPECKWGIWGGPTEWHNMDGVLVRVLDKQEAIDATGKDPGPLPILFIYLWGAENEKSEGRGDDASLWFSLDFNEAARMNLDLEGYIRYIIRERKREVKDEMSPWAMEMGMQITMPPKGSDRQNRFIETSTGVMRLLCNMLLYLDHGDQEAPLHPLTVRNRDLKNTLPAAISRKKNPTKARKLKRKLANLPDYRMVWIGPTIEQTGQRRGRVGSGNAPPRKEQLVRGHWRPKMANLRRRAAEAADRGASDIEVEEIIESGREKRRWILPYVRYEGEGKDERPRHYRFPEPSSSG